MAQHDYYETLGVSRKATQEEIRKAYKNLAREYHPDNRPDDPAAEQRFKEIQEANSVLSDPDKRAQYDRFGHAFESASAGGSPFNWSSGGASGGHVDLEDLLGGAFDLGSLFGQYGSHGKQQRQAEAGEDLEKEIDIPFQVAVQGGKYQVPVRRNDGDFERITVTVPAGVDTGSVIRLSGEGHPSHSGGPPGDLRLTIKVAPHPFFRREGLNILLDLPLTPPEAVLGTKIQVPTVTEGNITLTIPPGTSSGSKLRLARLGIPDRKSNHKGDQLIVVKIVPPKNLDETTRELYEQLNDLAQNSPRQNLW